MKKNIIIIAIAALLVGYLASDFKPDNSTQTAPHSTSDNIVEVVSKYKESVVTIIAEKNGQQKSVGSGFVTDGGIILSNAHVFNDQESNYIVKLSNGKEIPIKNIVKHKLNDLAGIFQEDISLSLEEITPIMLTKEPVKIGERVIAIGADAQMDYTVSTGIISAKRPTLEAGLGSQSIELSNVLLTDALIHPGNSGGPLLNLNGELVGINTATNRDYQKGGLAISHLVISDFLNENN